MQPHAIHPDILASKAADASERQRIEHLARRLYVLAWVIECVAVALGLGMALSLNVSGQSSFGEFLLGGGGFVMVACAELAKIPLATFVVETPRRRAKLATLAFLILMSFITFETIFMSLERAFYARLQAVQAHKDQLGEVRSEHAKVKDLIDNPSQDLGAARRALEKQLDEVNGSLKVELSTIVEERKSLRAQGESDLPKEIQEQLEATEAQRKKLSDVRDQKVKEADDRARRSRDFWLRERNVARKAGDVQREAEADSKLAKAGSAYERKRIEEEFQRALSKVDGEQKSLLDQRADLVRTKEAAIKPRLDDLSQREARLQAEYGKRRDSIRKRLDEVHRSEALKIDGVPGLTARRDELSRQIEAKTTELRRTAAESQLHRIAVPFARWWTGETYEPHTIPEAHVKVVAVVWFGSMAFLGAIGGAVVAMVSSLLHRRASRIGIPQTPHTATPDVLARRKFWISLRQILVGGKFSRVKTKNVEVVKEIEIVKEVEVVKEVVKVERETRIVAVPVPSNKPHEALQKDYERVNATLALANQSSKK